MNFFEKIFESRKEKLIFFSFFILAIIAFTFFNLYKTKVFPEIGIDLNIDKTEAKQKSIDFLNKMGVETDEYKTASYFNNNIVVKNYLERNLNAEKAGELMNSRINAWNFQTRFFKPFEQEDYKVSFDNLGRLSRFVHIIPENKAGASLEEHDALDVAESFLRTHYYSNFDSLTLVEKNYEDKEQRRDHLFVWEEQGLDINGAKKRVSIRVEGDVVTSFTTFLKIPEEWSRNETKLYSNNEMAQIIAEIFNIILISIPMIVLFVMIFKRRQFNSKFAFKVAVIAGVIALISTINALPDNIYFYNTLETWANFIAKQYFIVVAKSILIGLDMWLLVMICEAYFRQENPQKQALTHIFQTSFFQQKSTALALSVGFFCGLIVASYQLLYYFLGNKLGYWVPSEVNISSEFMNYFPWVWILIIGWIPAITEELLYRLFGITYLQKIMKKTWVAVLLSSLIWAFLHSAYYQQPFYARGIELLPVGIFFSILYLRFGIMASITAHYTLNALLTLPFLFKTSLSDQVISVFLFLIPVFFFLATVINLLRGKTVEATQTNAQLSESIKQKERKPKAERQLDLQYRLTTVKYRALFITMIILGASTIIYYNINPTDNGLADLNLQKSRKEIIRLANEHLESLGAKTNVYKKTVKLIPNIVEMDKDFILEQTNGFEKLQKIYNKMIPSYKWQVKYFKPLEKEEYYIYLLTDGSVYSVSHVVPENQIGAILTKDEALKQVEAYLNTRSDIDFSQYDLVEISEHKQDNRMDYDISYKNTDFILDGGALRISIRLLGDEISGYSHYIYIGEEWYRDRGKATLKDFIISLISLILMIIFVVWLILAFLKLARAKEIIWRQGLKFSLLISGFFIISELNTLTNYYSDYNNIENIWFFHIKNFVAIVLVTSLFFFTVWCLYSFALALIRKYYLHPIIPTDSEVRENMYKEALYQGYGLAFFLVFLMIMEEYLIHYITFTFDLHVYLFDLPYFPSRISDFYPLVSELIDNIFILCFFPLLFMPALILYRYLKNWWYLLGVGFVLIILSIASIDNINEMMIEFFSMILSLLVVVFVILLVRRNIFSLFIILYEMIVLSYIDFTNLAWFTKPLHILIFLSLFLPFFIYFCHKKICRKLPPWV